MAGKVGFLLVCFLVSSTLIACFSLPLSSADFIVASFGGSLSFVGNDVDPTGVIWAGDKNFTLWKSVDSGASFQRAYELPHQAPTTVYFNPFYGLVWTVFVDSRGYLFVSGGGASNSLLRSIDGGANFAQVIYTDDLSYRTFFIAMTEDAQGSLYTATHTVGFANPAIFKSTNGGQTWSKIGGFSVFHYHNLKFNPANGYLYAVTGERSTNIERCNDSEKIFRSKDGGASWSLVVDRNDSLGTVYLPIAFSGNWVYVGQDYPNRACQIHRFYDDGGNKQFQPQVVYSPPASDGNMPFISGAYFNNTLIFANCAEAQIGVSRILASADGANWESLYGADVGLSDVRWGFFSTHPRDRILVTVKTGLSVQIRDVPPPASMETPIPQPTYNPNFALTSMPAEAQSTQAPTPTPKPKATATPSPQPTISPHINPINSSTLQPTATPQATAPLKTEFYLQLTGIAAVICGGAALLLVMLRKRNGEIAKRLV